MTFVCFLQIFGIAVIRHVFGDKNWQTIWLLHRAQMSQFLLVKTNPDLINSFFSKAKFLVSGTRFSLPFPPHEIRYFNPTCAKQVVLLRFQCLVQLAE